VTNRVPQVSVLGGQHELRFAGRGASHQNTS
jgi:hypothetical protein